MYQWKENAIRVEEDYGAFVDYAEEMYICPECGEPIYCGDWTSAELEEHLCPICWWEGD